MEALHTGLLDKSKSTPSSLACALQLLSRNVKRFRGGLVFKAHRLLYHSTLGLRVIKKKKHSILVGLRTTSPQSGLKLFPLRSRAAAVIGWMKTTGMHKCAVVTMRARI